VQCNKLASMKLPAVAAIAAKLTAHFFQTDSDCWLASPAAQHPTMVLALNKLVDRSVNRKLVASIPKNTSSMAATTTHP
jgi:hypothetical protein